MDIKSFFEQYQDYVAPTLSVYEQAVYLYVVRHSRLLDIDDVVIGFKSARKRMAFGIGKAGTSMCEGQCYQTLRTLSDKGLFEILGSERNGTRLRARLPSEIPGVVPAETEQRPLSLEEIDFFTTEEKRRLICRREGNLCFYCLKKLNDNNFVIEHVVSRPEGDNTYRNLVAACRACNNKKGAGTAEQHLRGLFRESFLDEAEYLKRVEQLDALKRGDLKPDGD